MLYLLLVLAIGWVGHACLWTALLNNLYGRPLPKGLLRWWRHLTALILLSYPPVVWYCLDVPWTVDEAVFSRPPHNVWSWVVLVYVAVCLVLGGLVFPAITVARSLRKPPACVLAATTRTLDLWPELQTKLIGDHKLATMTRLPGNGVFRIDITDLTLSAPALPAAWDGLTLHVLSDLHFHGTPSRLYFERIVEELTAGPVPDLVCLLGDYVDSNTHHEWIQPILGRLAAREAKLAILGNHDLLHDPARVRRELSHAGYTVLENAWREFSIRGVHGLAIGHEGPWFAPEPDLSAAPTGLFRLCLSHTPDNFYWGAARGVNLMLCGHVHGGAIRVPVIGPIFVPSIYGRRFDSGVFQENGTVMVVGRGISGKEPIRFRCNPQVMRITLRVG